MGYHLAGFDVTGVDRIRQPHYPFEFIKCGAFKYLATHDLSRFDIIHASPPCQEYLSLGAVNRELGRDVEHPDYIAPIRKALKEIGLPYIIENVVGAPLRRPVTLCGTAFGLPLRRHRLFESSLRIHGTRCAHEDFTEQRYWSGYYRPDGIRPRATVVQVYGNGGDREKWAAAMGIDWMTNRELRQAIPPRYTKFLGRQLLTKLGASTRDTLTQLGETTNGTT
jgi:DNA (cytosine-5)-methyltransferase 1